MTLAEINPPSPPEGHHVGPRSTRTWRWRTIMRERRRCWRTLGIGEEGGTREGHEPSPFEAAVKAIDSADHGGRIQARTPASTATSAS